MAQSDFGQIVPTTKSGSALAADLNNWRDALHSGHRGTTRPGYIQGGMMWVQEVSSTTWRLYLYDGAQDILIGTANPVLDTFTISIGAGTVPASAIAGGAGSGLDADLVDGLHASAFLRSNASSAVSFGYSVRFVHPTAANGDDGKIGTRMFAKGLNIVGSASEANDAARYVTVFGNTEIQGALSVTGGLAMQSEIAGYARIKSYDGAVQAMVGVKGSYPALVSFNNQNNYGWLSYAHPNTNMYFAAGVSENGSGGSAVVGFIPTGQIWTNHYGFLENRFASRTTALGQGAHRDNGARTNCGELNCNRPIQEGLEVYDVGDGRHQIRSYGPINISWDCNYVPPPPPGDSGPTSCFPESTLVTLVSGREIQISEVRVGDILIGGFGYLNEVLAIHKSKLGARPLKVINGYHRFTQEHRHVSPEGWVSFDAEATKAEHNQWFDVIVDNAGTVEPRLMLKFTKTPILPLRPGVTLLKEDGYLSEFVTAIEDDWSRPEDEPVYSLVMSGSHTFLANGFIVSGWARDDDFDYEPWFSTDLSWR